MSTGSKPQELDEPPRRILLVQTAFIGDVVFVSPLVHAIKETCPDAHVALLVRPAVRGVAACIPGVDDMVAFDKRGDDNGPSGLLRVARRIRKQRFDLLLSLHRSARSALLSWMTRIPLRVGYRNGLGSMAYHISIKSSGSNGGILADHVRLLDAVGVPVNDLRLRLKVPDNMQGYLERLLPPSSDKQTKLVGLCIGAYWPTKRWPPVYFASLSESLVERGYLPVLLGGPGERTIATQVKQSLKVPVINCVGNTLVESAAVLDRCAMVVGGDSGLTHMARALGVPTVMIFGPTDPKLHSFGDKTRVLTAKVKCRPCSRHGPRRCPQTHHDCMRLVSPENVMDALGALTCLQTPVPHPEAYGLAERTVQPPVPS